MFDVPRRLPVRQPIAPMPAPAPVEQIVRSRCAFLDPAWHPYWYPSTEFEQPILIQSMSLIVDACCRYYGIKQEDYLARSRQQPGTLARMMAMYLGRQMTDFGFLKIAQGAGRTDHSTAVSNVRKVGRLIVASPKIAEDYCAIRSMLVGPFA